MAKIDKRGGQPFALTLSKYRSDFFNAHQRHWKDAELLYKEKRWANADHLYGLSAECGLKAVMVMGN